MLKFAIVGAENSHCPAIARLCNVEKRVPARVVSVWGEKPRFAKAAAEKGEIPKIVRDWRDLADDEIDGVMITHRHPKPHAEAAKYFIQQGIPTYVDKPFTYTLRDAKAVWRLAEKHQVPITSFSVIPEAKDFGEFRKACAKAGPLTHVNLTGSASLKSKYGGVFFYGIHQVESMVQLLGTEAQRVQLFPKSDGGGLAVIEYKDGPQVTLNLVNGGYKGFHWSAVGAEAIVDWHHQNEPPMYLTGLKKFLRMFRTGEEPYGPERLLAPVAILEAMQKSLDERRPVRVGSLKV